MIARQTQGAPGLSSEHNRFGDDALATLQYGGALFANADDITRHYRFNGDRATFRANARASHAAKTARLVAHVRGHPLHEHRRGRLRTA